MFTSLEKVELEIALHLRRASLERQKGKSRNPRFAALYDEDLRVLAGLLLKVQAMEVKK